MPPAGSHKPGQGNVATKEQVGKFSDAKRGKVKAKKPKVFQDGKDILQELLTKKQETSTWSVIILPIFSVILLGLGIAGIILGGVKTVPDLIVLGAMFLAGSVVFGLMLFFVVCRPCCSRNQVYTYEYKESKETFKPAPSTQLLDYLYENDLDEDLTQARNKPGPSEDQLYGSSRSNTSTPATTTNVKLQPESDTPPPPQVAIPRDPRKQSPVYTLDVDDAAKRTHEMKELRLL